MTPVFVRLPAKVTVAVVISLVAGMWAGDTFDLARVFGLLPFFVLGLKMHPGHWTMLRAPRARVLAASAFVAIFVLARFGHDLIDTEWLYYRSRYPILDSDPMRAATIRMVLLLVGLTGALAFFALVPKTRSWFSALGAATLVVYLFHGFFVLGVEYDGYPGWATAHFWTALPLTTVGAVVLALVLASPPVTRRLDVAVNPIGALERAVLRRRAAADAGPGEAAVSPVGNRVAAGSAHRSR
jgi:fucose 4-O-acetylase-like acetyltransferase